MSDPDAYEGMRHFSRHDDRDLDALFEGKAPAGEEELEDLATFLTEARTALMQPVSFETEARLVAAMAKVSQSLSEKGDPVVRPVSKANGPARRVSGLPNQRRSIMNGLAVLASKIGIAVAGLTITTTGLAFAGVDLPGSVAEKAFSTVGIDLPNQSDSEDLATDHSEDAQDLVADCQEDAEDIAEDVADGDSAEDASEDMADLAADCDEDARDLAEDADEDAREAKEEAEEEARDRAEDEADDQADAEEEARDRAEDEADDQADAEEEALDQAEDEAESGDEED